MKKILILIISIILLTGCSLEENEKVNIKKYESQELELIDYKDDNITARIPDGYKVEYNNSNNNILIRIYDPNNDSLEMLYLYKIENVLLKEPIIRSFFLNFNNHKPSTLKSIDNINIIEEFNTHSILEEKSIDDRTLRITFDNKEAFVSSTLVNVNNRNNIYNTFAIITPYNEYINYRPILTESISSIKINNNNNIEPTNEIEKTIKENINNIIKNIYTSYNKSWEYHQKEYDTNIQKEYDKEEGYIRVYDSKTNNIYKAYSNFMRNYHGSRYKRVTDNQYSDAIYGYIYE